MIAYYLTHPQVEIERERPIPEWHLSRQGRHRIESVLDRDWLTSVGCIVSSAELKAVETAAIIAARFRVPIQIDGDMGENDRSATGFLPPDEFEAAATRFFDEPEVSWQGWERAVDAAERIERATDRAVKKHGRATSLLFVGHGAVGTLLKCRIAARRISRKEDQPADGGNLLAFGIASRKLLCDWTPVEKFDGVTGGR